MGRLLEVVLQQPGVTMSSGHSHPVYRQNGIGLWCDCSDVGVLKGGTGGLRKAQADFGPERSCARAAYEEGQRPVKSKANAKYLAENLKRLLSPCILPSGTNPSATDLGCSMVAGWLSCSAADVQCHFFCVICLVVEDGCVPGISWVRVEC